jgi:hypothetical protein
MMIEQPGRERRRDFASRREDREIPRGERRDHADRLGHHHLAYRRVAARDDAAVGAATFLGEPFDDVGGGDHFALRLGEDLALLLCHRAGNLIGALAQQIGGLLDDAAAVIGRLGLPQLEALVGGRECRIEVARCGVGQVRERLLRGRIDDVFATATVAVVPLAVDVKPELRVRHGVLAFWVSWK